MSRSDRAAGALVGLALGDALGMPTQMLPRAAVVARYGTVLDGFHPGPPDHPIAAGLPAGSVTDDTEQAALLGRLLLEGGGSVDPVRLAHALVTWEGSMRARGSLDLLGPSTRRAVADLLAGADPATTGRTGTTNGAAMRVAPVGIAHRPGSGLVDAVVGASHVTHGTGTALAGAAAVAAAVSAGVDGASREEVLDAAVDAASAARGRGTWVAGADVAVRIRWAVDVVAGADDDEACRLLEDLVGTSLATQESVPAAFAVVGLGRDPWHSCRLAASLGGDCDTVAAMVGAVVGASAGASAFPGAAVAQVPAVHDLDLPGLAAALLDLRGR